MQRFKTILAGLPGDPLDAIRENVIGNGVKIDTPHGKKPLVYVDYTASGRGLRVIERYVTEEVLPFYANSHTRASHCGAVISELREEARCTVANLIGATQDHAVIFAGSGATAGVNKLVGLLGIGTKYAADDCVVFIGPYEHHSNIMPWRLSGATVVEIDEDANGQIDQSLLVKALEQHAEKALRIGAFSAASNVTGVLTDVPAVSRLLKSHGALSVWDYAAAAPYVRIEMASDNIDALYFSPHKFVGGPGASGVLALRRNLVADHTPRVTGGGSVAYVSPTAHVFQQSLEAREEAGTPNILGDIRAALVLRVQDYIGADRIVQAEHQNLEKVRAAWSDLPNLKMLGNLSIPRLPIFSFQVFEGEKYIHHQLVTRLLSDHYGIQARGGMACAGPYGHRLLDLDDMAESDIADMMAANEIAKPGWIRLGLSYILDDADADYVIESVKTLVCEVSAARKGYHGDAKTARFQFAEAEV